MRRISPCLLLLLATAPLAGQQEARQALAEGRVSFLLASPWRLAETLHSDGHDAMVLTLAGSAGGESGSPVSAAILTWRSANGPGFEAFTDSLMRDAAPGGDSTRLLSRSPASSADHWALWSTVLPDGPALVLDRWFQAESDYVALRLVLPRTDRPDPARFEWRMAQVNALLATLQASGVALLPRGAGLDVSVF